MSKSAIVVVRHACDGGTTPKDQILPFNKNIKFNNKGTYTKINSDNSITIPINWLGELGLKQAKGLAPALQQILVDYCPVSRIITEDVGNGDDGTSNPLHTINAYANTIKEGVNFDIYDGSDVPNSDVFSIDSLLRDGIGSHSTVICWEVKGMWRKGHGTPYNKTSILGLLGHCGSGGGKVANYERMKKHSPYKGQIVYVFECNEDKSLTLKMYNFDVNQPKGNQISEITPDSSWPIELCQDCEKFDVSRCKKE